MTAERRLAKVEAALTPTELVLRWLDEAHAFGDLEGYVGSQLAETPLDTPLNRLAREAAAGARVSSRGKGPEVVDSAVRTVLRETVFRFELVMRINISAHELLERERLICGFLSAHLALLACEGPDKPRMQATYVERLVNCRDLMAFRVSELCAAQEAREAVEKRYLAGHPALFPDVRTGWDEQVAQTGSNAALAVRLAEVDGLLVPQPPEPGAFADRVTQLTVDLVEPAKATALEKVGEGERALNIASSWVRERLSSSKPLRTVAR